MTLGVLAVAGVTVASQAALGLGANPAAAAVKQQQPLSGPILTTVPVASVPVASVPVASVPVASVPVASVPVAAPQVIAPALAAATKQATFLRFTTSSPQTLDRRGVEPSLYRGRFFRSSVEKTRLCIIRRESSGVYTVRGGGGNRYFGAYQMNDRLADGATWMMLPEVKRLAGAKAGSALMQKLRTKPVTTWPRYWQDAAFFTVYNWEHSGSGRAHWAGGRWHC